MAGPGPAMTMEWFTPPPPSAPSASDAEVGDVGATDGLYREALRLVGRIEHLQAEAFGEAARAVGVGPTSALPAPPRRGNPGPRVQSMRPLDCFGLSGLAMTWKFWSLNQPRQRR